jgi:hypothetical protein
VNMVGICTQGLILGGRGVIFLEVYNIHLSFLHDNMFICHNIILVQSES